MNTNSTPSTGMATTSMWLGIAALVTALLPFVCSWLIVLIFVTWTLALLSIIFGIIALCKRQNTTRWITGIILALIAIAIPYIFADHLSSSLVDSVNSVTSGLTK